MIFLDLDGVFADFDGFVLSTLGCEYSEYPPSEAWPHLAKVPYLFGQLEPLPEARELYTKICAIALMANQRVQFLTALPQLTGLLHTAVQDKTTWVHTHLDKEASVVCVPNWRYKSTFCRRGDPMPNCSTH